MLGRALSRLNKKTPPGYISYPFKIDIQMLQIWRILTEQIQRGAIAQGQPKMGELSDRLWMCVQRFGELRSGKRTGIGPQPSASGSKMAEHFPCVSVRVDGESFESAKGGRKMG